MTPATFKSWRKRQGFSQAKAAEALGISPRMVGYYESGRREDGRAVEIPKSIRLAAAAIALGINEYQGPQ